MAQCSLLPQVCDLSLMEARALRQLEMGAIRRTVLPPPVEVRSGMWTWRDLDRDVDLERARAIVLARAQWVAGDVVPVREPWRDCTVGGKPAVQYRADGEVACRGRGGSRITASDLEACEFGEWMRSDSMPDWSWRMRAVVTSVDLSIVGLEPVGSIWTYEYRMRVVRHG